MFVPTGTPIHSMATLRSPPRPAVTVFSPIATEGFCFPLGRVSSRVDVTGCETYSAGGFALLGGGCSAGRSFVLYCVCPGGGCLDIRRSSGLMPRQLAQQVASCENKIIEC